MQSSTVLVGWLAIMCCGLGAVSAGFSESELAVIKSFKGKYKHRTEEENRFLDIVHKYSSVESANVRRFDPDYVPKAANASGTGEYVNLDTFAIFLPLPDGPNIGQLFFGTGVELQYVRGRNELQMSLAVIGNCLNIKYWYRIGENPEVDGECLISPNNNGNGKTITVRFGSTSIIYEKVDDYSAYPPITELIGDWQFDSMPKYVKLPPQAPVAIPPAGRGRRASSNGQGGPPKVGRSHSKNRKRQ